MRPVRVTEKDIPDESGHPSDAVFMSGAWTNQLFKGGKKMKIGKCLFFLGLAVFALFQLFPCAATAKEPVVIAVQAVDDHLAHERRMVEGLRRNHEGLLSGVGLFFRCPNRHVAP